MNGKHSCGAVFWADIPVWEHQKEQKPCNSVCLQFVPKSHILTYDDTLMFTNLQFYWFTNFFFIEAMEVQVTGWVHVRPENRILLELISACIMLTNVLCFCPPHPHQYSSSYTSSTVVGAVSPTTSRYDTLPYTRPRWVPFIYISVNLTNQCNCRLKDCVYTIKHT